MALPEPVYRDEYIIQYKAETEDIVWELPPKIFSAVITDPPYLLVGDKKMNWDGGRDYVSDIDDNGFADDFDFTLLDMFDRLCINTNMTFFCNKAQLYNYFRWVYNNKKNFNLLSWHKPNCIPIGALYLLDTEFCVHTWEKMKTKRKPMNTYFIHNIVTTESAQWHPTSKPEKIVTEIIRQLTDEGDLVFEPFGGSGTTAVCCKRLKRKCVVVEHNDRYTELSIDRYKKTEAGIDQTSFM